MMFYADSVHDMQNPDMFEEHAIDTVHTLLLDDNVMPMTFLCETSDCRQILILYFVNDQSDIENKLNMVRNFMLLNNVERYIFASETRIPSKDGLNPYEDSHAKDGLVFLHADHHGLKKITQYTLRKRNGQIRLSNKTESDNMTTDTALDSFLTGPVVSEQQRQDLEIIVSSLPKNYPVKAFQYSAKIHTYQPQHLN